MPRIEKTVFISYRRTNAPWALAIWQHLHHEGYDVFFDFNGVGPGDFESIILENIRTRAHFLVLLTSSALERCGEPGDWLRREIEEAITRKRNIVPIMLEGFDFSTPKIANQLTGSIASLSRYQGLTVPVDFFLEAMARLQTRYLQVPVEAIPHPVTSLVAAQAAQAEQASVTGVPTVTKDELTAQGYFERGYNTTDEDEKIYYYSEAIRLDPSFAEAFNNRGIAHTSKGDLDGAILDFNEAIRLEPDDANAFYNRGTARKNNGDFGGAIQDYSEAIRLKPEHPSAFYNRGNAHKDNGDLNGAIQDYSEAIRLKPDDATAFYIRGATRKVNGDLNGALQDYNEAMRLKPDYANPYYGRAIISQEKKDHVAAIADFKRYLELGGGTDDGFKEKAEEWIRDLQAEL